MKYSTQVKPISYLKSHAAEIVKEISESSEPMVITQNGEAKLVVMDVRSFEESEETLALLKTLALGKREIEAGRFRPVQDVFAELENHQAPREMSHGLRRQGKSRPAHCLVR